MSTRNIDRQVTLDTTDSSSNPPNPANLYDFGNGAQDWSTLIPSGAGYMNKDLRSGNPQSSGTATVRVCAHYSPSMNGAHLEELCVGVPAGPGGL